MSQKFENDMQELIDAFRAKIKKVAEESISDFYTDVTPFAEMDSLTNFRNVLLEDIVSSKPSLWGYKQKEIRAKILKEHKDEIASLINQDLLNEIERLKSILEESQTSHYSMY